MVHIHAEGPAFFCWIPKLFGKRVICTIHGLDWDREKWRGSVASKFIRGGEKNAVKYADEIIVLSKDVQKYFLETYGRETHFIPNGVNRPEVREAKLITDHFGLEKDSYILFLGRLVPEKGIRYLVEAFKNVKTDKKLVIAGGSSDTDSFMEELKELAKGDDRILFTGFVQGAMLDELYSNAYIYTLPSDLEGMPLSLLEAMSYGNCCLVSDIPECAEVVEDNEYNNTDTNMVNDKALIFKKSDVEDLREKLQDVQTAASRNPFDVAGAGILDEVIGCLVNKNGIHNVLSFRGWHSEWNGILQVQYPVFFTFLLAVLKIGFVHFIHDAVHILRGQLSAGKKLSKLECEMLGFYFTLFSVGCCSAFNK